MCLCQSSARSVNSRRVTGTRNYSFIHTSCKLGTVHALAPTWASQTHKWPSKSDYPYPNRWCLNKAQQLATEIEKVWVAVGEGRLILLKYRVQSLCRCVSYPVLLDPALGFVQLVLQVPDDLFVFGVMLVYHLPLPLRLLTAQKWRLFHNQSQSKKQQSPRPRGQKKFKNSLDAELSLLRNLIFSVLLVFICMKFT